MRPEFIFLDLGNVIVNFDRARSYRQMAVVADVDEGRVRKAIEDGGLQEAIERGGIDWPAFHEEFCRRTGSSPCPDALARATSDMFDLNVAILPVIAGIERAGIPIGILSNTCGIHWEHLLSSGYAVLPGHVAATVLSHEVGAIKPEPAIYEQAAELVGVAPERIFFCDDILSHVEAARRAGWDAELFTTSSALIDALDRRGVNLGL